METLEPLSLTMSAAGAERAAQCKMGARCGCLLPKQFGLGGPMYLAMLPRACFDAAASWCDAANA
jgi:hypothetical protein